MKIFIETNILISASLFPGSTPARAYEKAVSGSNSAVVSDQVIEELRRVYRRKFPDRLGSLDAFLAVASSVIEIAATPSSPLDEEGEIRDVMDRPILRAAVACGADVLVTGDKDFLESRVAHPRIMTAAEFCENG